MTKGPFARGAPLQQGPERRSDQREIKTRLCFINYVCNNGVSLTPTHALPTQDPTRSRARATRSRAQAGAPNRNGVVVCEPRRPAARPRSLILPLEARRQRPEPTVRRCRVGQSTAPTRRGALLPSDWSTAPDGRCRVGQSTARTCRGAPLP